MDLRQIDNVNIDAGRLAEMFGNKFWNDAKFVVDQFAPLPIVSGAPE